MAKGESYEQFVAKFDREQPKTTDDCITPREYYDVILNWVEQEYKLGDEYTVRRPFYPGGDYKREVESYGEFDVVIDNPPFSILSKIIDYYNKKGIKYFLFAPTTTIKKAGYACFIYTGSEIEYENGAKVVTCFVTNLENTGIRTAPKLFESIKQVSRRNRKTKVRKLPSYVYPDELISIQRMNRIKRAEIKIGSEDLVYVSRLDAQKGIGKAIYGGGFLVKNKSIGDLRRADEEARRADEEARRADEEARRADEEARRDDDIVFNLTKREKELLNE